MIIVFQEIISLLIERKDFFLKLTIEHLKISLISIIIAIVLGLIIGILISQYNKVSKWVLGVINFIYTIPSIALLGILIPISGIGDTTAIIVLAIYALLPMVRNTYTGISNIDKNIIEAAEGMGSTNFQLLYKIKLPLAIPIIFAGIRSMVTMTIALVGIASFIGAGGLGVAIYRGITTNNSAMTILGSLFIAILAVGADFLLGIIENNMVILKKLRGKLLKYIGISLGVIFLIYISVFLGGETKKNTITIATKPMTEQYVLGEILRELIEENTDLKVEIIQGVGGGTSNIQPAIEKGEIDIYPEYTGTGWNMVLKREDIFDESKFDKLKSDYNNEFNLSWMGMYGFENTYGLAVRKDISDKYDLKTYSDLARVSDKLNFGAEYDFYERKDGYDSLCKEYGFNFKSTADLDIGLKYEAINQGQIDVMNIFTTDGRLSISDVTVLIDDKDFYPSYNCGNVVRNDVLEGNPQLKEIFKTVEGILSNKEMAELNYKVESLKEDPKTVALEFLRNKKLIK